MDKKSKNILDNKAKAILREHLVAFETYDIAYIVNDGRRYSRTNSTEVLHKMDFSIVIISEGKEYRANDTVVYNPYTVKNVDMKIWGNTLFWGYHYVRRALKTGPLECQAQMESPTEGLSRETKRIFQNAPSGAPPHRDVHTGAPLPRPENFRSKKS